MSKKDKAIHVLIADDHPMTRIGIRTVLEQAPDIEVVGEAKDGIEAKQMLAKLQPDILLLDLVMPGLRPFEIGEWVHTNHPETITLVLTAHAQDCYLAKAIEAEAVGFLTKEDIPRKLVEAIRRAVRGEVLITRGQLARVRYWRKEVGERWESLTEREREVLALVVGGQSNQQVAEILSISECTVRTHIGNILGKLGVSSRTEAIVWVWQHGMAEEMDSSG